MVKIHDSLFFLPGGGVPAVAREHAPGIQAGREKTMAYSILKAHNTSGGMDALKIKFDALASHDITYVGIIQTARASGLEKFPIPYVLTNCHNSLCAVGGTINEDDHMFGLSAAKKYGGVYVPAHMAVIHQYMREMEAACGRMILGSDSHTRYGALGTMAVGEGGPELVKQLLSKTYDIDMPQVVAVYLTGEPAPGVGPQDVALALIGATFQSGFVKNKVLEFVGPGISKLSADYRIGIDVMTTETTCLSSIWQTDAVIEEYFAVHGRPEAYKEMGPGDMACYDGLITIDLSKVKPMIAMPFHPSNVYSIEELNANLGDILQKVETEGNKQLDGDTARLSLRDKIINGKLLVQQGVIAGCAGGTFENLVFAADIINGCSIGSGEFSLSVYPASQPVNLALTDSGVISKLMTSGATIRTAFCGPCFGAGDVPVNNGLSIRHSTRNFPNREGSKPQNGQLASVALMDARSIAATAVNGGILTAATDCDTQYSNPKYFFNGDIYKNRCYSGFNKPEPSIELKFGPGIADWPSMQPLTKDLLLRIVTVITDPVTTTDELIPSGETSSFRSNPLSLAQFTLSRKDPAYVGEAGKVQELERARLAGKNPALLSRELQNVFFTLGCMPELDCRKLEDIGIGSAVFAVKPGDGSAREQAASCQKVLGTYANFANEYATKRYRSNLINWGMLPFLCDGVPFKKGDFVFVPDILPAVQNGVNSITAYILNGSEARQISLTLGELTDDERKIILAGCLINFYRDSRK